MQHSNIREIIKEIFTTLIETPPAAMMNLKGNYHHEV